VKDDPQPPPDGQRPDLPSGSDEGRPGTPDPPATAPVTEPDDECYDAEHFEDL
jgi:hypothetical protein